MCERVRMKEECPNCGGELRQQGPFKECLECGKMKRETAPEPIGGFDGTIMEML